MKITTTQYNGLLAYAKRCCEKHPHVEADDVLNIVLLKWVESKREFSESELKTKISGQVSIEANNNQLQTYHSKKETTRVCAKCGEDMPIGAFDVVRRGKYNREEILYYCRECQKKYVRERYQKIKHTESYKLARRKNARKQYAKVKDKLSFKLKQKERIKQWHIKNREKWNAYLRERYRNKKSA